MPCNSSGFGPSYSEGQTELERKWEEEKRIKQGMCRLLTQILFYSDEKEFIFNIKKEADGLIWWYNEHLDEDIKEIKQIIFEYKSNYKFEKAKEWEKKLEDKKELGKKITQIIDNRENRFLEKMLLS